MILVIDVGNTHITLGLYEEGRLKEHWRLSSKIARTEDEFWIFIRTLCESAQIDARAITGIALGSVVPSDTTLVRRLVESRLPVHLVEVTSEIELGITICYENPSAVGADRICNAVAGFNKYGGPLVIVDFGTATTFDIISDKAEYLGGIIAPGLESAVSSLHRFAAKLPEVDLRFPSSLVGTNTEMSMQAGLMYGGAEMVEGLIRRVKKELSDKTRVIATGGLASVLLPELPSVESVEARLTLDGLYQIYMLNQP